MSSWNNQTYQQLYENGEAWMLDSSYYLLWNYQGFDHLESGNPIRFAGPGKHSKNTLLTADSLFWNEANALTNAWSSTHPIKTVKGTAEKSREDQRYFLLDPTETRPDVKMNAGYTDGSVRRYSAEETVRGVLEIPSYVKIYYPSAFR
jgi:hypothetical protein